MYIRSYLTFDKVFVAVWSLKGEVDNGGFDQWFFNSSGDWAIDTPRSLREIGAVITAKMVEEAIAAFPGGAPPVDIDERRKRMESASEDTAEKWDVLSTTFYEEEEDLDALLQEYVDKNIIDETT